MNCFSEHGDPIAGPTESENCSTSRLNTKFWREFIDRWYRAKYADSAKSEVLTALLLNIQTWPSSLLGLLTLRMMALQSFETCATHVVGWRVQLSRWHCSCVRRSDRSTCAVVSCEFVVRTSGRSMLWPVTDVFQLQIHGAGVQLCLVISWWGRHTVRCYGQ